MEIVVLSRQGAETQQPEGEIRRDCEDFLRRVRAMKAAWRQVGPDTRQRIASAFLREGLPPSYIVPFCDRLIAAATNVRNSLRVNPKGGRHAATTRDFLAGFIASRLHPLGIIPVTTPGSKFARVLRVVLRESGQTPPKYLQRVLLYAREHFLNAERGRAVEEGFEQKPTT